MGNSEPGVIDALLELGQALVEMMRWALVLMLVLFTGAVKLLGQMFRFFAAVCNVVAKMVIMAGVVAATFYAAVCVFSAYGADLPALIPAALLVVVMTAIGLSKLSWGALLAGALTAFAIGTVLQAADIVIRSLILTGALATTITHNQINRSESNGNRKEKQPVHSGDQDRTDLLHDDQDSRFSHVDTA